MTKVHTERAWAPAASAHALARSCAEDSRWREEMAREMARGGRPERVVELDTKRRSGDDAGRATLLAVQQDQCYAMLVKAAVGLVPDSMGRLRLPTL